MTEIRRQRNRQYADTGLAATGQIYLDNNSTTPIAPVVLEAMSETWSAGLANPSSQHRAGQSTAKTLADARHLMLELMGADQQAFPADQLILTSGGTESNNLFLLGAPKSVSGNVVISGLEHPSVTRAAELLRARGFEIRVVDAESSGRIDPSQVATAIDESTQLVSVILASNETGVIQPVQEIASICREQRVLSHTDAVQAVGKLDVSFRELGVDALTFTPHKFHGPNGIGGLVLRAGLSVAPLLVGGFQQQGIRAGTENVALTTGAAVALSWYVENKREFRQKLRQLRDEFELKLKEANPEIIIIGQAADRLPNTSCVVFPGVDRQAFVLAADVAGIACATGSACASGSSEPSPALLSMGLDSALAQSTIRFSFGVFNDPADGLETARRISILYKDLKRRSAG